MPADRFPSREQAEKPPQLTDLDVKGREILGLEPKFEKFSRLQEGRDYVVVRENTEIESEGNLRSGFLFVDPQNGTESHLVQAPHWRAISQEGGISSYRTSHGLEYFYTINTKGVGYLKPTLKGGKSLTEYVDWNRVDEYGYPTAYGLAERDDFFTSEGDLVEKSKKLTDEGLRTELYYAIAEVQQVYYQGDLVSVKELKDRKIIPRQKSFQPHIGIRLLRTNARIAEVKYSDEKRSRELFQEAFDVFNRETEDKKLNIPKIYLGDPESERIYFKEFFKRMGENVAILQNMGYIGWHMHSANVTLAAEIVDIGPYESWKHLKNDKEFVKKYQGVRRGVWKDVRDIAYGLRFLLQAGKSLGMSLPDKEELYSQYNEGFLLRLDRDRIMKEHKTNPEELITVVQKITKAVVVEGVSLPSLKQGSDVTAWGIV